MGWRTCTAVAASVLSFAVPAHADRVSATIVRIDGVDFIVDLGGAAARAGGELEVFRTVEVRHPVTRRTLRDRFVIGRVRIVQPGETLSIARLTSEPSRTVQVGDIVELELAGSSAPTRAPPSAPPGGLPPIVSTAPGGPAPECPEAECAPCPACNPGTMDPEVTEILLAWRATLGRTPEERAQIYEAFLQRNPRSRFGGVVRMDIDFLRALGLRSSAAAVSAAMGGPTTPAQARAQKIQSARRGGALKTVHLGQPAEVALGMAPWAGVKAMQLHVGPREATSFRTIPMTLDGSGHARATVPASLVVPGGFSYFVEAIPSEGTPVAVLGAESAPQVVDVVVPPAQDPRRQSRVRVSGEFVNFNQKELDDWYFLTEGDFLYRVRAGALSGVRVGYGVYRGEGGELAEIDPEDAGPELAPQPAGFTYGYTELEIELHRYFGVRPRVSVGLGQPADPASETEGLRGGFQARLRLGDETSSHLVIAGETVPELGQRAFIGLVWDLVENFPMATEVHVTDQPVNSDELAVRLVYEVSWLASESAALGARLSYQGRRIDHAGFGGGLVATFDW